MKHSRFLDWANGNELARLDALVARSPYNKIQWSEAMHSFEGWMVLKKRPCDYAHMLGYLECAADYAQSSGPLVEFSEFLLQLLGDAGYDGPDDEK